MLHYVAECSDTVIVFWGAVDSKAAADGKKSTADVEEVRTKLEKL